MDRSNRRRLYRIGDFARYLGVTPDFLKHYENNGLLTVSHKPSGYRYFSFDETCRVLEYFRLRNYGFSVKEMHDATMADTDEAFALLDKKAGDLKLQAQRIETVLEEHARLKEWFEKRKIKPIDWDIRNIEAHHFLPHSYMQDFIEDQRIYDILSAWTEWMPFTKSAMRIETNEQLNGMLCQWGLWASDTAVRRCGIPLNDAVLTMPACKAFVFHFCGLKEPFNIKEISEGNHPAFKKLTELGFKAAGPSHLIVEIKLQKPGNPRRDGCGRFFIPVQETES